ncbi:hypothetical protein LCGC14_0854940 [marine sediment metagenome]|uniref:Uncharacterized protein n=1 Tax=marine sediment metagenome TaxID=412755 RepID=A0A0F9SG85_9ZZZZ
MKIDKYIPYLTKEDKIFLIQIIMLLGLIILTKLLLD